MRTSERVALAPPGLGVDGAAGRPSSGVEHWFRSLGLMMRFDAAPRPRVGGDDGRHPGDDGRRDGVHVRVLLPGGDADDRAVHRDRHADPRVDPARARDGADRREQQKVEGTFDFIWSLPTPRSAQAASTFVLYTALSIPGMVVAVVIAAWKYGVTLSVSPAIVPAVLLSSLMAISVGFGMALAIKSPIVVNLITNTLVFVVLLFSPIVFPASHLPPWLMDVHRFLPFYAMAQVVRAGLTDGIVVDVARSYVVLVIWTLIGWGLTASVIARRR